MSIVAVAEQEVLHILGVCLSYPACRTFSAACLLAVACLSLP